MTEALSQALLLALPLIPATGAIIAGLLPRRFGQTIRAMGWVFSIGALLDWILLRAILPGGQGLMVELSLPWVPEMGIGLHLGLDGTGFMMAGLVSFVGVAGAVGTLARDEDWNRTHVVCLLVAEAGMLGVVASWDLILFIACWELTLVAFFFLLGRRLSRSGLAAATQFVVTSIATSVLMWVGVLWVVGLAGGPPTFDLIELSLRLSQGAGLPPVLVWLFAAAFLVRMAAIPLHTWFPAAAADVPIAASILLAGGVLPLGGFGLVHILGRLFGPDLAGTAEWFVWLGLVTCLAGGLASLVQRDLKRLFAYVCLAQVGLAMAGLASASAQGQAGGLMMLVAAGLGGSALFLFAGVVCKARGSQRVVDIGGLWRSHPLFAGLAFAGVASAAAVPATAGFVGAFRLLWGTASNLPAAAMAAAGILVTGSSVVWAYRRVLGGSFQRDVWTRQPWPRKRQVGILLLLALALIFSGLFPGLVMPAGSHASDQRVAAQDPPPVVASSAREGQR